MASNSAITAKKRGSYDPVVKLADGSERFLSDLMIELHNQQGDVAGVKENIAASYTRTVNNNTNDFIYSPASKPEAFVYVPSLTELGFQETGHRIDVLAIGYFRTPAPTPSIELKLVDADGNEVAGSLGSGDVVSNLIDTPLKTVKAAVTGGSLLALDFRRTSGADEIILYNYTLLIQVVKV